MKFALHFSWLLKQKENAATEKIAIQTIQNRWGFWPYETLWHPGFQEWGIIGQYLMLTQTGIFFWILNSYLILSHNHFTKFSGHYHVSYGLVPNLWPSPSSHHSFLRGLNPHLEKITPTYRINPHLNSGCPTPSNHRTPDKSLEIILLRPLFLVWIKIWVKNAKKSHDR